MKKTLKLFLSVSLFMVIAGCNNRVSLDVQSDPSKPNKEFEVLVSASFEKTLTRVYPSTLEEMVKARVNFKGLRVVFYKLDEKGNPTTVAYQFDYDINATYGVISGNDFAKTGNSEMAFKVKTPMKLRLDSYHVYIIAGPTAPIKKVTTVGKEFNLIQKPLTKDEDAFLSNGYIENSIFINSSPIIITKESIAEATQEGKIFTLPECSLAPINGFASVTWSPIIKDQKFIISSNCIFLYADVQNKKYILLPEYDKTVKKELNIDFPIDANFTGYSTKDHNELSDEFLYLPISGSDGSERSVYYASSKGERKDKYLIIPENTMDANDYYGTVVTRLIIMAFIYPAELDLHDIDINKFTKRDQLPSWIYFKGKGYSENEFTTLYNKSNSSKQKTQNDIDIIMAYRELTNNGQGYPKSGYQSNTVSYYKYGTNFFSLPIQHFTPQQIKNNSFIPGLYSVVRNTHYSVNINSFQSIGAASEKALKREVNYKDVKNIQTGRIHFIDTDIIEKEIETLY